MQMRLTDESVLNVCVDYLSCSGRGVGEVEGRGEGVEGGDFGNINARLAWTILFFSFFFFA